MGIFTGKKFSPVTEAYYGKPKELYAAEKELQKIIDIIKKENPLMKDMPKTGVPTRIKVTDLNNLDSTIAVERLIKKYFGFSSVNLCFYYAVPEYQLTPAFNAYTMPRVFNYFRKNKDGNQTKPDGLCIGVNVDICLITYTDITAEELMGVILHEIGHNMDTSAFTLVSRVPIDLFWQITDKTSFEIVLNVMGALAIIDIFQVGALISGVLKKFESLIAQKLPIIHRICMTFWDIWFNFITPYLKFKKFTSLAGINWELKLLKTFSFRNIFGYAGEKYADSFATAYGYGEAVATLQAKFGKGNNLVVEKIAYEIPGVNWAYDFMQVSLGLLASISDPHPQDAVRVYSQLKKLKRDLNDPNMNPRLKKELQEDIKDLEDFINNEYLNIQNDDNKKRVFSWLLNMVTIKIFDGVVDFRELSEKVFNHEI